jgi:hypothetical protein
MGYASRRTMMRTRVVAPAVAVAFLLLAIGVGPASAADPADERGGTVPVHGDASRSRCPAGRAPA